MTQKIRWILLTLLITHGIFASAYLLRFPAWRAPDEGAHFAYVLHLFRTGRLPVFEGMGKGSTYEAHQPPLYYLTAFPLAAPLLLSEQTHHQALYLLRFISVLWGALVVLCAFALTLRLQIGSPTALLAAILSGAYAALLPMHLLVCASVGNDAAAGAMASATLLWLCHLCFSAPTTNWRRTVETGVTTGVLCGAALLAKSSNLIVFPLALLAGLTLPTKGVAETRSDKDRRKKRPSAHRLLPSAHWLLPSAFCLLVVFAFALTAGWWLWRNSILYGDPLAMKAFLEGFAASPKPSYFLEKLGLSLPTYLLMVSQVTLFTWLGIFGEPNEAVRGLGRLMQGEEPTAGWVMLCSFVGVALFLAIALGITEAIRQSWKAMQQGNRHIALAHALPVLLLLLVFAEFAQFNRHFFQAQARYFYPAHASMGHLFALGIFRFVPEGKTWLGVSVGISMLIVLSSVVWWQWAAL